MCEDPATYPKGDGVRVGRVENIRMRIRSARQNRQSPPTQKSPSLPDNKDSEPRPTSPLPGVHIPNSINSIYIPERYHEIYPQRGEDPWYKYRTVQQTRRDCLIEIAMRTILLLRQNKLLLRKVADLEKETRIFMRSVMNNQQNGPQHIVNQQQIVNEMEFNRVPPVVNHLLPVVNHSPPLLNQLAVINRKSLANNVQSPTINHQPPIVCHQPNDQSHPLVNHSTPINAIKKIEGIVENNASAERSQD